MKALFEYAGFTRMEDVPPDPPPTYSLIVSPPFRLNMSVIDFNSPATLSTEVWNFELHGIEYVDGEQIAIYRFDSK